MYENKVNKVTCGQQTVSSTEYARKVIHDLREHVGLWGYKDFDPKIHYINHTPYIVNRVYQHDV